QELRLLFAPVMRLVDDAPVAAEAVLHWDHPQHGLLPLDDFAAAAERAGLTVPVGAWALREACRAAAAWNCPGVDDGWAVAVAVSARQVQASGFAATVAAALADAGLPAARLAVEVTEATVLDSGAAARALTEVAALGVTVTLDRFGAGHSALGVLHAVPAGALTVDGALVERATAGGADASVAAALVTIARGFDLTLVARGVATAAQVRTLAAMGYRYAQGPHFGGPLADLRACGVPAGRAGAVAPVGP
ncbi:MAG TPA: EAL domain-containing protein, partial [Pilimelia sp.]|nr:EAL domain-containing protein [Pilimelia sp.]